MENNAPDLTKIFEQLERIADALEVLALHAEPTWVELTEATTQMRAADPNRIKDRLERLRDQRKSGRKGAAGALQKRAAIAICSDDEAGWTRQRLIARVSQNVTHRSFDSPTYPSRWQLLGYSRFNFYRSRHEVQGVGRSNHNLWKTAPRSAVVHN